MAIQGPFLLCLLALAGLFACTEGANSSSISTSFNRTIFPSYFIIGAGSSAYQYEGAAFIDGKGPSIWDTFTKNHPEKISDGSTGDVAVDFYHLYKDDIALMKRIGLDSFRFSISWSRVIPKGNITKGVNQLGVNFYNNLIDELIANDLTPFVTLFHWDLPQALEDAYGGLLNSSFVDDYREYVNFCFKTFGDRVKHWVTLNEPYEVSTNGYGSGAFAPGRCSNTSGNCTYGDSATEPYIAAHNLLLGHVAAVKLYKETYQSSQNGSIGITLNTNYVMPLDDTNSSRMAASRALDFMFGWFCHPVIYGDYPPVMRELVGDRLPNFTEEQSQMLKGSLDFLGVNYYSTSYAADNTENYTVPSYSTDSHVTLSSYKNGVPVGTATALSWLFDYPRGILKLMLYIKEKYGNPPIYITENGVAEANNASLSVDDAIKDSTRIKYYHGHFYYLAKAIKKGVNVKGFYAWSFLDDFEWASGFTIRFGFVYIDYDNGLTRYLKNSAYWLKSFLLN